MKLRTGLLLASTLAVIASAGVGFWLVFRVSPDAAVPRAIVDGGLLVAMIMIIIAFTRSPAEQISSLVEAIRDLAVGRRDRRFRPEEYGDLGEVARAYNVLAASMTEHEDPNLGPIRTKRRESAPPLPYQLAADERDVGDARPMAKEHAEELAKKTVVEEARRELSEGATVVSKVEAAPTEDVLDGEIDESKIEFTSAYVEGDDEDDEAALDSDVEPKADENASGVSAIESSNEVISEPPTVPEQPSDDVPATAVRELFSAFVEALEDTGVEEQVSFEEFVATIEEQRDELMTEHGCKDVRFTVHVEGEEVSLLPRLVR